jgi:CheY-like chemotaxis protein
MSLKILVVDDEQVTLRLMRSLATPLNHTVLTFEDSLEAGQRLDTQRFDAVFVGMHVRPSNGLELAHRIRSSQLNSETILVMLNEADDIQSVRSAFGEGADLVLTKPVTSSRLRPILAALDSPDWKGKRHAARLPLFTEVSCSWHEQQFSLRSMNISESGMLLQPSVDVEVGQEVALEFKIAEVRATLKVRARIARKEGAERVAVEFVALAPEDQNAILLYVTGRLKDMTPPRDLSGIGMRRLYNP